MTIAVLNALLRPMMEGQLPQWLEPRWYETKEEALALAPEAEIGLFDFYAREDVCAAIEQAVKLKWLNSLFAGVEKFPLALMQQRGVLLTNGAGINAVPIAEWVVMGMLAIARGYREIVRAQERREWLRKAPGERLLMGSRALILGYGAIGQEVESRLAAFGIEVSKVRRSPGAGVLGPDQWRARLGEFDWVIVSVPATAETEAMIGAAELAAMKRDAVLVNVARGSVIDQQALTAALAEGRIGGALLDVTSPEPLPSEDALWGIERAHVTMHLSGHSLQWGFQVAARRFVENLGRYQRGEALQPLVDYVRGY
ncbi:MAG TPA: D-2-hydroxyacid dehydrogenase [Novosphingobium sp.]|nr:D-2-hydroxyacid dehydrogenase [Novosphingobium sp.]